MAGSLHGFVWVHADSFLHCVASPFHSFVTTYLLTLCGAAAVDKLNPTSLARLQLQRLHTFHLVLQSRLLSAGFISCFVSALRMLYPTDSYKHACDFPSIGMGT